MAYSEAGDSWFDLTGEVLQHHEPDTSRSAHPRQDSIAIVGMGMRLPGGIKTEAQLWDLLVNGKDAHGPVPPSRYNAENFFSSSSCPGSVSTRHGYFLQDDIAQFDAEFFSVNATEAAHMDPQQRLLLEVVWECLQNGGQVGWRGKDVGCFVGVFGADWMMMSQGDSQKVGAYDFLGCHDFTLANRLSYEFDWTGPSVTVETGCSSTLVAFHQACRALQEGDCSAAVVAGCNLILSPTNTITMCASGALSGDGKCRPFDATADGYGRGKAINCVYLKRYDEALREGDPVRAIVRSTTTNCDGRTPGFSVPNPVAQAAMMRKAYDDADLPIGETGLFECHGTGTQVGDKGEASAVASVFEDQGIYLGSVKANVGHSGGGLGLDERHQSRSRHGARVPFELAGLRMANKPIPWPRDRLKRASVNSFGIGGTNAHAIVQLPEQRRPSSTGYSTPLKLLVYSASSPKSLDATVKGMQHYIEDKPQHIDNVAYTLGSRREHLRHRAFTVHGAGEGIVRSGKAPRDAPSVNFVFTGQGSQWRGMSRQLILFEEFRFEILRMSQALRQMEDPPSWRLEDAMQCENETLPIDDPEYAQPLCTALQIGIVAILNSWNIKPDAVVGHSSGEIAAAYAAGAVPSSDAIRISFCRGRAVKLHGCPGAMAAVSIGKELAAQYLHGSVVIACESGPESVTLSGNEEDLALVLGRISTDRLDVRMKSLDVPVAYHSRYMKGAGDVYKRMLDRLLPTDADATATFYSTVTGKVLSESNSFGPAYWRNNLVSPVQFYPAILEMMKHQDGDKSGIFLEIGPHSSLSSPLRSIMNSQNTAEYKYIPTVVKQASPGVSLYETAGQLYLNSVIPDFLAVNGMGDVLTDLPLYAWDHEQRYWNESPVIQRWRQAKFPHHELLGSRVAASSDVSPIWRNVLSTQNTNWMQDHRIQGRTIMPVAGYVAAVGEAIRQISGIVDYTLCHLRVYEPLLLPEGTETEFITSLSVIPHTLNGSVRWYQFTISSFVVGNWMNHCTGEARAGADSFTSAKSLLPAVAWTSTSSREVDSKSWYALLQDVGYGYGPCLRKLTAVKAAAASNTSNALVDIGDIPHSTGYYAQNPVCIDHLLQLIIVAATRGLSHRLRLSLPVAIEHVYVKPSKQSTEAPLDMWATTENCKNGYTCDVTAGSIEGTMIGLTGCSVVPASPKDTTESLEFEQLHWHPIPSPQRAGEMITKLSKPDSQVRLMEELVILCTLQSADIAKSHCPQSPHMRKYAVWLQTQVASLRHDGSILVSEAQHWSTYDVPTRAKMIAQRVGLSEQMLEAWQRDLVLRVYENMAPLLTGEKKAIELLYEDEGLKQFYQGTHSLFDCAPLLSNLGYSIPRMKILEIGGGTGGFTTHVLDALAGPSKWPLFLSYTFTDISPGFFPAAQEHLKHYLGVDYSGTLPGWWLGQHDQRVQEPYVTPNRWNHELRAAGFTGADTVVYDQDQPFQCSAVILSTKGCEKAQGDVTLICHSDVHPLVTKVREHFQQAGYNVETSPIHESTGCSGGVISLLEIEGPFFYDMSSKTWQEYQRLLQRVESTGTLWVTKAVQIECSDPRYALTLGAIRTSRSELQADLATLEAQSFDNGFLDALLTVYERLQRGQGQQWNRDFEYMYHNGEIHICRYHRIQADQLPPPTVSTPIEARRLTVGAPGNLGTLQWKSTSYDQLQDDTVVVDIKYAGLNFRDVLEALAVFGEDAEMGMEASGIISQAGPDAALQVGQSVLVTAPDGMLSTRVAIPSKKCISVPNNIALVQAAAFPCVYGTAVLALLHQGNLRRGHTVLIHSACGGVGLAAIGISKLKGATIYATVGQKVKAEYLNQRFGIPMNRIFSSRDRSFYADLMRETNGRGVDIVLNSLAGELFETSWECVAKSGKMIEIGKKDIMENKPLRLGPFLHNRSFICVNASEIMIEQPDMYRMVIEGGMDDLANGRFEPIAPIRIFPAEQVESAFRHMQSGKHIGKVVVQMPQDMKALPLASKQEPSTFPPNTSYLMIGGWGGIGRAVSRWMVDRGARDIVYLSRSSPAANLPFSRELEAQGCRVSIVQGTVTNAKDVEKAVQCCDHPIKGVFQMAMVLNEKPILEMSWEEWHDTLEPKVIGTWNLHHGLLNENLDFFLLFSSIAGIVGQPGLANYAAANTFLDGFVQYRHSQGLPAAAIDIGVVAGGNHIAERLSGGKLLGTAFRGYQTIREKDVIRAIEVALTHQYSVPLDMDRSSSGSQITLGLSPPPRSSLDDSVVPIFKDPRMSLLISVESKRQEAPEGSSATDALMEKITNDLAALSSEEAGSIIQHEIIRKLAPLANLDEAVIGSTQPFSQLGVDSLIVTELRTWLRRSFRIEMAVPEITAAGDVAGLTDLVLQRLQSTPR
ncbi:putative polyketide synthase [Aspergillus avenaceus]|uniref:Putative polyketide synthase n=1 Tax=Aspergillus avenaceus TaxID=36643 RepID=A0A5N6TLG7_ASPAV|nr:putative polyketide synthase [Aspergillus avenaceus]